MFWSPSVTTLEALKMLLPVFLMQSSSLWATTNLQRRSARTLKNRTAKFVLCSMVSLSVKKFIYFFIFFQFHVLIISLRHYPWENVKSIVWQWLVPMWKGFIWERNDKFTLRKWSICFYNISWGFAHVSDFFFSS